MFASRSPQSLSGHTSAVECVSFDSNEQTVIAGSAGGTLKLWDLEQAKVARTLTGHLSNCVCVQWHPYGEFFASGSVDTNLKIWDIRRKQCIQTYKGHARGVRQIIFSPDGKWVVSGGDDGVVKLWDLTAGRPVHEFTQHSGAISALAIHPTEFLMASASADRTLRLWDLESFEQVCCFPAESGQVRRVLFSDDGGALLSGTEEALKVWGWEPVRCHEQMQMRWSRLADMCVSPGEQLLAGSVRDSMVTVWNVNLSAMRPFSTREIGGGAAHAVQPPSSPSGCRVIAGETPPRGFGAAVAANNINSTPPAAIEEARAAVARSPVARTKPRSPVSRVEAATATAAPAFAAAAHAERAQPAAAAAACGAAAGGGATPEADETAAMCARMQIAQCRAQLAAARLGRDGGTEPTSNAVSCATGASEPSQPAAADAAAAAAKLEPRAAAAKAAAKAVTEALSSSGNHASIGTSMTDTLYPAETAPTTGARTAPSGGLRTSCAQGTSAAAPPANGPPAPGPPGPYPAKAGRRAGTQQPGPPHAASGPIGLGRRGPAAPPALPDPLETGAGLEQLVAQLTGPRARQEACLAERLAALRVLHSFWEAGEVKKMLQHLARLNDPSISVDIVRADVVKGGKLDLESALVLLPILHQLLSSTYEEHAEAAIKATSQLCALFGPLIRSTRAIARDMLGVDLSAEARQQRCQACYEHFAAMVPRLQELARAKGLLKEPARDALSSMRSELEIS